ncbi:MAG TPA: di-heme oxidoredictase family protein [Thermoanaerobaculia bacterium]|jgi:CxxC motif-containing protein (DUF1111 family)|nr:di-heme oxidoredictase family protein [Thermoanaerobaculia bacterium]
MKTQWLKRFLLADALVLGLIAAPMVYSAATEAPAGFDNLTNGFTTQAQFDLDLATFDAAEEIDEGLGPVYNAQACRECHQNPVSGSNSQIEELRAGRLDAFGNFTNPPGGSLINDRSTNVAIKERITTAENVVAERASLNTLGDGFVEAIADTTITNIRNAQPTGMKGTIISVPILESPGFTRFGRFGWKNQQASLLSFSADAYLNEMGITSPLQNTENTSMGNSVAAFDPLPEPEEAPTVDEPFGPDVHAFARFMRSTKVPPRDTVLAATADAVAGSNLFVSIGCSNCHTPTIQTAPVGTVFNGTGAGKFTVTAALGDKIIHPYSDFMLHDVGTGDGIIQNGGTTSRNKLRTMPLWGLRSKSRLMHDQFNTTRHNTILRHTNEAEPVIQNYINLNTTQQNQILTFLNSL